MSKPTWKRSDERTELIDEELYVKLLTDSFIDSIKNDPVLKAAIETPFDKDYVEMRKVFLDTFLKPGDKFIQNSDRKWFQFWKPKMIKNPHYDPNWKPTVEIDIKRGNRNER